MTTDKNPTSSPVPQATDSLPALPQARFDGIAEFSVAIRLAFQTAAVQGWREIILSDLTFEDWPLGERAVAESLHAWAKSGRKLTLLAKNYDEIMRRHARFVSWRRTWAHVVDCRKTGAVSDDAVPSALWSPVWVLNRLDTQHCRGVTGFEAERRVALKEQLQEHLRKSSSAFPATTLGI